MANKVYKLSLEQLNDIVSDAVTNAIKKLDNLEIVEDEKQNESTEVKVGEFSEEQYKEAIDTMAKNRGAGDEPKVGIFWYNPTLKQLFGVVSHKRTDYLRPNAGGGLITCSEMHEDVWKQEYYKQKYRYGGSGPFKGEYQYKPRGRVFYSPAEDKYIIAVGSWIKNNMEALPLIYEEFDLPKNKTILKQAHHWDIGQTWM